MLLPLFLMLAGPTPAFPVSTIGDAASWITSDDYPAEALRENATGITAVELQVGLDGSPTDCAITSTSGSAALDAAACDALMRRAHFRPARDRQGRPMLGVFSRRVVWHLPARGKPMEVADLPTHDHRAIDVVVNGEGEVISCSATVAIEPPHPNEAASIQPCDTYPVGRGMRSPIRRDGRPVGAHLHIVQDVQITYDR